MNFERHIEPKESMRIGQSALGLRLEYAEFINRDNGKGNWWVERLYGDQLIQLLKFLVKYESTIHIKDYYSNIMDISFVVETDDNFADPRTLCILDLIGKKIFFENKIYNIPQTLKILS